MSRRRISVKELGHPDHQGWLYRKKESKGFLGMKWKKYWFVLKKTSFYWYSNQQVGQQPSEGSSCLSGGCKCSNWDPARAHVGFATISTVYCGLEAVPVSC